MKTLGQKARVGIHQEKQLQFFMMIMIIQWVWNAKMYSRLCRILSCPLHLGPLDISLSVLEYTLDMKTGRFLITTIYLQLLLFINKSQLSEMIR